MGNRSWNLSVLVVWTDIRKSLDRAAHRYRERTILNWYIRSALNQAKWLHYRSIILLSRPQPVHDLWYGSNGGAHPCWCPPPCPYFDCWLRLPRIPCLARRVMYEGGRHGWSIECCGRPPRYGCGGASGNIECYELCEGIYRRLSTDKEVEVRLTNMPRKSTISVCSIKLEHISDKFRSRTHRS